MSLPNSGESTRSLVLFFLHNFFISIGTILIYVCATVLLLQNNPDLSLPLGYFLAAAGCMLAGKAYEHFEHRLSLKKLIRSVMLVIVGLVILLSVGLYFLDPFVEAVVLLIGYRAIYLLSGLEFWGLSALVFDVRQSKRIFGIIGSGDLPAKAIGALLAVLIHSAYSLYILLWVACAAFLLAYLVQTLTFRSTVIPDHHAVKRRTFNASHPRLIDRLFGGSWLVYYLCLGMVFVSAAAIFIEYSFFVNVKHKYHDQDDVMSYLGYLLTIAFGTATVIKLLLSSRIIERFGLRTVLILLPVLTAAASIGLYLFSFLDTSEVVLLNMFSGLYIFFEITRKTTYDPVFLVLFQPLFLHQRLKAHTLAKGIYEPLGMGIAGVVTLIAYLNHVHLAAGSFLFITALALGALYFLVKAHGHYLLELKNALSKRFFKDDDLLFQENAEALILEKLGSSTPSDVLFSLNWLASHRPDLLAAQFDSLLHHPSENVRRQTLLTIADSGENYDPVALYQLAQRDESAANRKLCGMIACQQNDLAESQVLAFLNSDDLSTVEGSIIGCKRSGRFVSLTDATLRFLTESEYEEDQLAALDCIQELGEKGYEPFVYQSLNSRSFAVTENAIAVVARQPDPETCAKLLQLTHNRTYDKQAIMGLLQAGEPGDAGIRQTIAEGKPHLIHFIATGCERFRTPRTLRILIELLASNRLRTRTAALRSLSRIDPPGKDLDRLPDYLQQEFDHLYHLVGGLNENSNESLNNSLDFEVDESIRRIFYLFMLTHDARMVENAMLNIEHSSREKRANAIEILDNIIPRNEYLALHALLDETTPENTLTIFEKTVCRQQQPGSIVKYVLANGTAKFSEWSVVQAINATPGGFDPAILLRYIGHADPLVQEAAILKSTELNLFNPQENMVHHEANVSVVSPLEKVMVLKRSPLFENTPENVLSAIVPIITEQTCGLGEVLFEKGELGTCMYVIYSGTVEIFDGKTKLAQFGPNDIFGELALLDAETRSASAVIADPTLLFRIDQDDFYDLMEERSELLKSVLSILCKRIRMQNDRLRRMETLTD
ncbi:MFS transporter [Persicitalea jodogahamensis]|uniref:Cyclic nucleotide-binding domain-containing protein n=1 Tax=Persicitalea jodogahamensis TaxID=402147 RepID=A0A8J3D3C5_9BACT|nr:MFS transporter [Persicitalea jodogahamensis]GHB64325.1 hypothetical protein GCM10007390_17760 [Persicitalea jodogahamensis]